MSKITWKTDSILFLVSSWGFLKNGYFTVRLTVRWGGGGVSPLSPDRKQKWKFDPLNGLKTVFLTNFSYFFLATVLCLFAKIQDFIAAQNLFFVFQRGRLLWEQRYKSSPGQSHRVMYLSYYFSIIIARQYIRLLARWCIFRDPVQLPKVFFPRSFTNF